MPIYDKREIVIRAEEVPPPPPPPPPPEEEIRKAIWLAFLPILYGTAVVTISSFLRRL